MQDKLRYLAKRQTLGVLYPGSMAFEGKPFNSIGPEDILALQTDQVAEGKAIDYKQAVPGGTDDDKREFLADISSFANAAGGYIVFGVAEEGGVPVAMPGLGQLDADKAILRLESIIRDGIEPRIPGIATRPVSLPDGKPVLLLRIPRSWASPHMVIFKKMGIRLTQVAPISCGLGIFLGSVTG